MALASAIAIGTPDMDGRIHSNRKYPMSGMRTSREEIAFRSAWFALSRILRNRNMAYKSRERKSE